MAEDRQRADLGNLRIDSPAQRPGLRRSLPVVEILIVACLLLVAWLLLKDRLPSLLPAPAAQQETTGTEAAGTETQLATLPPSRPGEIVAGGYIEIIPPGATTISSDVDGRVTTIHAVPGQVVSAGEILATLDSSQLRLERSSLASDRVVALRELQLAQAGSRSEDIDGAQAEVNSAQAELALAEEEVERAIVLYDKGIISLAEKRTFETKRDTAKQLLSSAHSRLSRLQAGTRSEEISIAEARIGQLDSRISELDWKIAACRIASPVDGVVLEQFVDVGDWITTATDNPASAAILSLYDPQAVQAWADINQRDSGLLAVGQPVTLTTDARPDRPVSATLSAIMPLASIQKNTVQVKLRIEDVPPDFRPGLGVRVAIDTGAETEISGDMQSPDQVAEGMSEGETADVE